MSLFKTTVKVFKSYDYSDKLISLLAVFVFLAMMVKMIIFPYGLFSFGESNIYTEGLVSTNGFQNINPLFVDYNDADRDVSRLVFSGLMKYDTEKRAVVDDIATLSINESKTEYLFVLKEGLKWHDGEDITAEDVYFTFHDLVMNPSFPNQILKINFAGVKIELINNKTIKFILEKPNIFFITNLTTGILPKHILKDVKPADLLKDEFNKKPIGNGPYMVTDPVETFPDGRKQITLTRNPYFYGDPSEVEFMRFITYPSFEHLLAEINSVNGVVKVSGKYIGSFTKTDRFTLIPYELPQYTAVFMNMETEILKDNKNIRLALQKSIDKTALLENFIDKKPVDTPLMELEQEDWIYQANKEQAEGALKDAGYNYLEEDQKKEGFRYDEEENVLSLNMIVRAYEEGSSKYNETMEVVNFLVKSWENIGIEIQLEFLDTAQLDERIMRRDYDLLLIGQSLGYNLDTYSYWHSTQATPNGQNFSNYKSFRVDSLIEDIRSVFNKEKRTRELMELAEQIKEDIPAIFLYRPVFYYAIDDKISGITMDGVVFPGDRFSTMYLWKFKK